ncbi:MAG: hypothetical protein AAB074_13225 [Planctomycetota bacterium]
MSRCQLCGAPCNEAQEHCSKPCAHVAKEAARDGIEARVRRAFQRRKRAPSLAPDPEAEQMLFEVEGFWGPGCAGAAEEILRCAAGVHDASIVGDTGRGRASFDPEQVMAPAILDILRRYGFRATLVRDAWARSEGFSRAWELTLALRLGVSVTLAMIVFVLTLLLASRYIGDEGGDQAAGTVRVLMLFLTLPVLCYGGFPIFANAFWAVARRRVTADLLTAAAAAGAFLLSLPAVVEHKRPIHFDAACACVVLTLFARLCEYRARRRLARVGERFAALVAGPAMRVRKGEEIACAAGELRPGDVVLVAAGARVPADGDVVEGSGVLEPVSGGRVEFSPGDRIAAGARLNSGRLVLRAERTGAATSVGEVARIVEHALASRMPGSAAVTRGLFWAGAATATFGLLALFLGETREPLLAVLLAASPSAIALLPSIAGLSAMGRAAERLACFRSGEALAAAANADGVVLARSAMLEPRATADAAAIQGEPAEFWSVVASLVSVAQGPVAAAIRERARSEGATPALSVPPSDGPLSRARVDGRDAAGGDRAALEGLGWRIAAEARPALAEEERGRTLFWAGWDGEIRGAIAIDAAERQGAAEIGSRLKRAGLLTCLAGADADAALDAQAARLGLDTWMSEAALADGMAKRRANGRRTALVARAAVDPPPGSDAADLTIAVDCAEEGAPEWAAVVALGPDVRAVDAALGSARRAARARRLGGTAAFLYHVAALPCAAAGLVSPMAAVGLGAVCALGLIHTALRAGGNPGGQ